jgi:hypothetical protein
MTHREDIQRVLAAWRAADRALAAAIDGERPAIEAEIERTRAEYHRVSSAFMTEHMDKLREAEGRRAALTPSTPAYHQAARDTVEIAADIWETGRQSDRDIPGGSRAEAKV